MVGAGPIHTAVDHKDLDHIVPAVGGGLPVSLDPNAAALLSGTNAAAGAAAHPRRKSAIRALKKCGALDPHCGPHQLDARLLPAAPAMALDSSQVPCKPRPRLHLNSTVLAPHHPSLDQSRSQRTVTPRVMPRAELHMRR